MTAATGLNSWDNQKFRRHHFTKHQRIRPLLEAGYMKIAKRFSYVQANQALLQADRYLMRGDLKLSWDDDRVQRWCEARADEVAHICMKWSSEEAAVIKVKSILDIYGIQYPDRQAELFGDGPALRRCSCPIWWRRNVRVLQGRAVEELARSWRLVHNKNQIYCSDVTVGSRIEQKRRNNRLLSQLQATNDIGQEYLVSELAELAVSNPKIRRSELMVRMRGFEDLAASQGRVGEFYTITCPSKYHSTNKGGIPNGKWNGATVREANDYLCGLWCRVRASLKRSGVDVYGFRVAEPNHDGCPHWHLLLFCDPVDCDVLRGTIREYALAEDPEEPGAREHRFTAVAIDPSRGSATGYIAKYISKNIDGHGLHDDLYGHEAKSSAVRIEAWASRHGIRQFQQIGGPSVTVWRELRRLDKPEDGIMEECRIAADSANWSAFCMLMGSGRGQALQIARLHDVDVETGECISPVYNRYGEPAIGRIVGLIGQGVAAITRIWRWTIQKVNHTKERIRSAPAEGFALVPDGIVHKKQGVRSAFAEAALSAYLAVGGPPRGRSWSSVNNCTGWKKWEGKVSECSK